MMTTKFPLSAILMELAATLSCRGSELRLNWIPREQNIEADELSNGDARAFRPELEIKVDLEKLNFVMLPELLDTGEELYGYVENVKKKRASLVATHVPKKKRKPDTRLRVTHPW